MRPIHIFKTGKHQPANGGTISFSESDLQASAEAYDPATWRAPIVIGHPKDNKPAFGWVDALSYAEGDMHATPGDVNPDFAEMVNSKAFPNRSASFYRPDSPANPVPGVYYLRHIGFLGAEPPSLKGLEPYQFSEDEEGVVEFTDPQVTTSIVARLFRQMREHLIERDGRDAADKTIPDYAVSDLEAEARAPASDNPKPSPSFSEGTSDDNSEGDMTPEQIKAEQEKLDQQKKDLETKAKELETRETQFAEKAAADRKAEDVAFAEKLVTDKKLLPAHKSAVVALLGAIEHGEATVQFAEGDENKIAPRDALKKLLERQPERLDFNEKSKETGERTPDSLEPDEIASRALKFQEKQADEGVVISIEEAVAHITEQADGS